MMRVRSFLLLVALLLVSSAGPVAASSYELVFQRTRGLLPSGHRRWNLTLQRGGQAVASWPAVSGTPKAQTADRRWSPGNGAPLPVGRYSVGWPERWDGSWWVDLSPRFSTTRSALGIHTCLPGSGCICLPSKADTDAVVAWIRKADIRQLRVVN